jgi:hypothetical protein
MNSNITFKRGHDWPMMRGGALLVKSFLSTVLLLIFTSTTDKYQEKGELYSRVKCLVQSCSSWLLDPSIFLHTKWLMRLFHISVWEAAKF